MGTNNNGTKNIPVVGDVHIGSVYGLLPPAFVRETLNKFCLIHKKRS